MKHLLLVATFGLLLLSSRDAFACTCEPPRPITPKQWLDTFDGAIFRGYIVKAETFQKGDMDELKLTFRVERHWRGVKEAEIVIWTDGATTSCGIAYPLNTPMMVYAPRKDGRFQTHMCDQPLPAPSWEVPGILGRGSPPPK